MPDTTIKERPILFSGPMVRAILDGSKTQTRRVVKPQPSLPYYRKLIGTYRHGGVWTEHGGDLDGQMAQRIPCPYGKPGDRLWVREACRAFECDAHGQPGVEYLADGHAEYVGWEDGEWDKLYDYGRGDDYGQTVPSIHMPRWASRITLEITEVRVERLQEISEWDCRGEGLRKGTDGPNLRASLRSLWDSINAKTYPWDSNPWVWAVTFKLIGGAS